ncbi:MarR family transcriptional regulator [Frankia sp. Cppng1_Ct_nod]|uniref:MarR family winged helix-turn-helix transcriptional regulator n=1 Tax=Frankia sp. Cppng1_Ct_nod TaxID=2897162 RepID=UPI0010418908|nr:MarR family transcriptional regulator [Frankia sp. Cppng1_Ct_nod]
MTRFAGGPAESPGFLLWHVTLRWQRAVTEALGPLGLTHVQFVLLACTWWLNEHGQQPNQVAIATQAATDIRMTSQILSKLERKGLVARHADTRDTRAKVITVTDRGAALAQQAIVIVEQVDSDFFGTLSEPFLASLRVLAQLERAQPVSPVDVHLARRAGETPQAE